MSKQTAINLEEAVISIMLQYPIDIKRIIFKIKPEYFSDDNLKKIFQQVIKYIEPGNEYNVLEKLRWHFSKDDQIIKRINNLFNKHHKQPENIYHWIQILRNKYQLRSLEHLLNKYTKICKDDTMNVDKLITNLKEDIDDLN